MRQICRDCKWYCIHCETCRLYMENSGMNESCSDWESDEEEESEESDE